MEELEGPPDYHHLSLLQAAAFGRCTEVVPLLLTAGAEVELRDINATIEQRSVEVLEQLLRAGRLLPLVPNSNGAPGLSWLNESDACPLLYVLPCNHNVEPSWQRSAACMLEMLLDAGYKPTTYFVLPVNDMSC